MTPLPIHRTVALAGLAALVWFGALNQALYDYWAAVVFFSGVTLLGLILAWGCGREGIPARWPLKKIWAVWLAWIWGSTLHSYDTSTSLWEAWNWTFCAAAFYLVVNAARDRTDAFRALRWMGWSVFLLACIAIHQQFTLTPVGYGALKIPLLPFKIPYGHWEIHATLLNSNVFAGFILAWVFVFAAAGRRRTFSDAAALLAAGVALGLARSWTSAVCLLIGAGVFYRERIDPQRRKKFFAFLLIAFTAVVCAIVIVKSWQKAGGNSYLPLTRLAYFKAAVAMALDHPWSGVGIGAYATAFPYYKYGHGENSLFAHSLVFQVLAELGWPGLVLFGIFFILILRRTIAALTPESRIPTTAAAALATLLAFSLDTIFLDYLLNKIVLCVWIAVLYLPDSEPPRPDPAARATWIQPALVSAFLLAAAPFWLSLFQAERFYVAGDYARATALNPRHADSYWQWSKQASSPAEARDLLVRAWRWKKDVRYMSHSNDSRASSGRTPS